MIHANPDRPERRIVAFKVEDHKSQADFKAYLEGLGYTDCSDAKERGYFTSVYFRTPGGALFEAAYTLDGAFLRDEIIAKLEPIAY